MEILNVLSFSTPRYKVRIWRHAMYRPVGFTDIQMLAMRLEDGYGLTDLAIALCNQPTVVKVEVLDWDDNGVLCSNE